MTRINKEASVTEAERARGVCRRGSPQELGPRSLNKAKVKMKVNTEVKRLSNWPF